MGQSVVTDLYRDGISAGGGDSRRRRQIRLAYLTLQGTKQGQAAHAHVHEIVTGVRDMGLNVDLLEPAYGQKWPSVPARLRQFATMQRHLWGRLRIYDALYIRAHPLAYPIAAAAHRAGLPVLQECNGPYGDLVSAWPSMRAAEGLFVAMQRQQYAMATRNIAVTRGLADWVDEETGRRDTVVVPNAANTDLFRPDLPRPGDVPSRYVVFFGALAPWQGLMTAIRAMACPEWPIEVNLVIVGDGLMRAEVDQASAADPRIRVLGRRPYADVPSIVASSLASLSVKDGRDHAKTGLSPLKVYEAMSCGVPTIVSDRPGIADLISDSGAGVVVPENDPVALARAVADLNAHPLRARRMGEAARRAAVDHHSWHSRVRVVCDLIDDARRART